MISRPVWTWPASLVADLKTLAVGWSSLRGGWLDTTQLLAHRQILVNSQAGTRDGMQVVLRSRLRLNGDAHTDILRSWVETTPRRSVEALATTHFQGVAAAVRGCGITGAISRLVSRLIILLGMLFAAASAIRSALEAGWGSLVPVLLANWQIWLGIVTAVLGMLLRSLLRIWLRWKFRSGLAVGP